MPARLPERLPMSVSEHVAETFYMARFDAQDSASADQRRARYGQSVGDGAEEHPAENARKDDDSVVEGGQLHGTGVPVREDNQQLRQGKEHAYPDE